MKAEEEKPKGQPISHLVDKGHTEQIMEMGFEKHIAEKALLLSGMKGVEAALEWINNHMDDEDYNEELFLDPDASANAGPAMTPEEAKIKALELQRQLRERHAAKQAAHEREKEANRIINERKAIAAKKEYEEAQHKRDVEAQIREKKEKQDRLAK